MPLLPLSRRSSENRPSGRWRLSIGENNDESSKKAQYSKNKLNDDNLERHQNKVKRNYHSYNNTDSEDDKPRTKDVKRDKKNKKKKSQKKKSSRPSAPLIRVPVLTPNAASYYSL